MARRPEVASREKNPAAAGIRRFLFLCIQLAITVKYLANDVYRVMVLYMELAERRINDGILFVFSPFYEYSHLEYEHVPV